MFGYRTHLTRLVLGTGLIAALALGSVGPAFADTLTGSATVNGDALTMVAADSPSLSTTLDGTDQTISDTFAIDVNDPRGTGAGWNLSITSTTFSTGGGTPHMLPANAAAISAVGVACDQGTCSNPDSSVELPVTVPADVTAPTAITFFNATADSGMGDFTVTPTYRVTIPANTYAGEYSSTITITVATGP
jgi:hypothetical protein